MDQAPPPQYSEYPRGPLQPRIRFETISEALKLFQAHMGPWVLAAFLLIVLSLVLMAPFYALSIMQMMSKRNPTLQDMLLFYMYLIPAGLGAMVGQAVGLAGMYNMAVKQIETGTVSIADFFNFRGTFLSHLGAGFLVGLLIGIGSMACYLPGFIFGGLLLFTQPIIAHQRIGTFSAMTQSWNLLKPQLWMATAFYFIITLVAGLGGIACGIGMLFTYPLYPIAVSLVYRDYMKTLYGPSVPSPSAG